MLPTGGARPSQLQPRPAAGAKQAATAHVGCKLSICGSNGQAMTQLSAKAQVTAEGAWLLGLYTWRAWRGPVCNPCLSPGPVHVARLARARVQCLLVPGGKIEPACELAAPGAAGSWDGACQRGLRRARLTAAVSGVLRAVGAELISGCGARFECGAPLLQGHGHGCLLEGQAASSCAAAAAHRGRGRLGAASQRALFALLARRT
jgi:hypothetical protein